MWAGQSRRRCGAQVELNVFYRKHVFRIAEKELLRMQAPRTHAHTRTHKAPVPCDNVPHSDALHCAATRRPVLRHRVAVLRCNALCHVATRGVATRRAVLQAVGPVLRPVAPVLMRCNAHWAADRVTYLLQKAGHKLLNDELVHLLQASAALQRCARARVRRSDRAGWIRSACDGLKPG